MKLFSRDIDCSFHETTGTVFSGANLNFHRIRKIPLAAEGFSYNEFDSSTFEKRISMLECSLWRMDERDLIREKARTTPGKACNLFQDGHHPRLSAVSAGPTTAVLFPLVR